MPKTNVDAKTTYALGSNMTLVGGMRMLGRRVCGGGRRCGDQGRGPDEPCRGAWRRQLVRQRFQDQAPDDADGAPSSCSTSTAWPFESALRGNVARARRRIDGSPSPARLWCPCRRGCRGVPAGCGRAHRARRARWRPFHARGLRHAAGAVLRCGRESRVGVPGGGGRSRVSRECSALVPLYLSSLTPQDELHAIVESRGLCRYLAASSVTPRSPRSRRSPRCWRARESPPATCCSSAIPWRTERWPGGGPEVRRTRQRARTSVDDGALWHGHVGGTGDGAAARDGLGVTPEGGQATRLFITGASGLLGLNAGLQCRDRLRVTGTSPTTRWRSTVRG